LGMKRRWIFLVSLLSLCICLLFSACETGPFPEKQMTAADLVFSLDGEVQIKMGDSVYTGTFQYDPTKVAHVTVESPEELKGLSYFWKGDSFQMTYEGLSVNAKDCPLDSGFAPLLIQALNAAQQTERLTPAEKNSFQGHNGDMQFTVTADSSTGRVQSVAIPKYDFLATFTYPAVPSNVPLDGEVYAEHP
jgi:hypothetical protein